MPSISEDHDFITNTFPRFDGWCMPEAAYLTCHLMESQHDVPGVFLEIGVYKGKYFSVLCHKARQHRRTAVGIDIFVYAPKEGVQNQLTEHFQETAAISLVEKNSRDLTPADLRALMASQPAVFVSVDGDHTPGGVHHDLVLAAETLAQGGIVAIDDFLNARAIGVNEGVNRFFLSQTTDLRPFVYSANKLFACHATDYERFKQAVLTFTEQFPEVATAREFQRLLPMGHQWVEQELFGAMPWIL